MKNVEMIIKQYRLSDIVVDPKTSRIDSDVTDLVESIKVNGLLHPLIINSDGKLIAGGRRLKALQELGYEYVPVIISEAEPSQQEILAIDENIKRLNLDKAEEANALARRKELYEKIHPTTKHGGDRKSDDFKTQNPHLDNFADDTAKATDQSKRTIQQQVARDKKATDEVKKAWQEEKITKSAVDELIKLPSDKQNEVLPKIVGKDFKATKKIARALLRGEKANQSESVEATSVSKVVDTMEQLIRLIDELSEPGKHYSKNERLYEAVNKLESRLSALRGQLWPSPVPSLVVDDGAEQSGGAS